MNYANPRGGKLVTIQGSNFPRSLDELPDDFSLAFDSNSCELEAVSSTEITCIPGIFPTENTAYTLTLSFNGKSWSAIFNVGSSEYMTTGVSPNWVSPVLRQELVIQLDTVENLATLGTSNFFVNLVSQDDEANNLYLAVFEVDNTLKQLHVMYGGAVSGVYDVEVVSKNYGRYAIDGVTLLSKADVTNISPRSGSILGGTVVTITGNKFSDDKLNNHVTINLEFATILSSSENTIVARIPAT